MERVGEREERVKGRLLRV